MNFSDSFEECVYCGARLQPGIIEAEDTSFQKEIWEMTDEEILEKYAKYKQYIEEQTKNELSDAEFINGIKSARRESHLGQYLNYNENFEADNGHLSVSCPYCKSTNTNKISTTSKIIHTAMFGIFSMSRNSKNFHCNNCGADF